MSATADTLNLGRLPEDVTSFVGRQRATSEVRRLLTESRLVTLTGVGGVGKTRLAIQVARQVRRAFADGVWLVELAKLTNPSMVATTVMAALGVSDSTARDPVEALVAYLADKRLLLVLDNCEHLLSACAQLTATVLPATAKLHILATSREPLGVLGEQIWPVPPLSLPDPDSEHDGSQQYEALTLFKDRAAAIHPGFTVDSTNRQTVIRLCRQLDGLPLAIELAAAVWLRTLSVEQILTRLHERLHLPAAGRGVPTRHQTLRATVEWSYELCTPLERRLWARLSIFTGEFDLDAAEHVCVGNDTEPADILTGIAGLIDKSILVRGTEEPMARYRMLDTIREYGADRLASTGQTQNLRRRHRDHYLSLAERADAESCSPRQTEWIKRLRTEGPNIWAALEYCLTTPGEARTALRMAGALWLYWIGCGFIRDGRHWLDHALALSTEPTHERAQALWLNGWLALLQGDNACSLDLLSEARRLSRQLGDEAVLTYATQFLGAVQMFAGNLPEAVPKLDEALRRHRESGRWTGPGLVTFLQRSRVAIMSGDIEQALALLDECTAICGQVGERWIWAWSEFDRGCAHWAAGDPKAASTHFRDALRRMFELNDQLAMTFFVEGVAWTAVATGDMRRAATLFGAAEQGWKFAARPMFGFATYLDWWERCRTRCRQALGEEAFNTARQRGARLTPEQIIAIAQGEKTPTSTPATSPVEQILTKREREVATLIAQGKSNKDIAATLVIAQRTVEGHVEHILRKLGATSRAQIAVWIAEHPDG